MRRLLLLLLLFTGIPGSSGCACNAIHEKLHGIFPFCSGGTGTR